MSTIRLSTQFLQTTPNMNVSEYPGILTEYSSNISPNETTFYPFGNPLSSIPHGIKETLDTKLNNNKIKELNNQINPQEIICANIGINKVIARPDDPIAVAKHRTFKSVPLSGKRGPLIINDKRWYFRLVQGKNNQYKKSRALMDDFDLNEISRHMVVCFTPEFIPGRKTRFVNQDGEPMRIYALFDSYLDFFYYMQKFPLNERAFYEIIFGELPQKPHFDIDIDLEKFSGLYPQENMDVVAEILREAVITACIQVLSENMITIDIEKDILLYSSHGQTKRSYHLILNNKCHDGNKEAKAFYDAVMRKTAIITNNKYLEFVDGSVYSPRQQFRLIGCQKQGSNRPKVFYEQFNLQGKTYTHEYTEDVTDVIIKKLTIIYESMISFTSGCIFLPSLIPPSGPKQIYNNKPSDIPDLDESSANYCFNLLRQKMSFCPFSIREITGNMILLHRHAPSHCPICNQEEPHQKEHPYIFMVGGKVYWDCRRSDTYAGGKKLFLGYLAMSFDEIVSGTTFSNIVSDNSNEDINDDNDDINDDGNGQFTFGDYNIGTPTLPKISPARPAAPVQSNPPINPNSIVQSNRPVNPAIQSNPPVNPNPTVQSNPPVNPTVQSNPSVNLSTNVHTSTINNTIAVPPPEYRCQDVQGNLLKLTQSRAEKKYIKREPEDITGICSLETVKESIAWTAGYSNK